MIRQTSKVQHVVKQVQKVEETINVHLSDYQFEKKNFGRKFDDFGQYCVPFGCTYSPHAPDLKIFENFEIVEHFTYLGQGLGHYQKMKTRTDYMDSSFFFLTARKLG